MKFVHTADLHIGKSRTLPDYLDRQAKMLDEIYRVAKQYDTKLVLMAGDIFESKNIRWNEQQLFMEKLFMYDSMGFTTIVCNGNHDELAAGNSHLWLPSMIAKYGGLKNTCIVDGEARIVELEDLEIGVIPVVHKNVTTEALSTEVRGLYSLVSQTKPFVVMLHATIAGCNTDSGISLSGGPRIPQDCEFVDYWALGDIHKCQQMAEKAWYSGAPMQHDFGDKLPKGVLVVTVEKGQDPDGELVELEGITPLVTLTEVPEKWPTGCHIRYVGPMESVLELPANVVKTERQIEVQEGESVELVFGDSVTEGLPEFLHAKGIEEDMKAQAVTWVQERYCR